jgi:hypothetical protein
LVAAAVAWMAVFAVFADAAVAQHEFEFPAGVACADFGLGVDTAGGNQQVREFVDDNGNTVRILSAGTGFQLTFTNLSTDATFALSENGAVTQIVFNADGSQTVTLTGHNLLILFPTDVPAGPSTTVYVGRVVFTVDADGVFTVVSTSGTSTDICAALS